MKQLILLLMTGFIFFSTSCEKISPNAVDLSIDFSWSKQDRGSNKNPEIRVTGVTENTKYFSVALIDLDMKTYDHGGGKIENDGSGIIARGSVKGNYEGPNPTRPIVHSYEIEVKAYDENDVVIGIGKMTKRFPPE